MKNSLLIAFLLASFGANAAPSPSTNLTCDNGYSVIFKGSIDSHKGYLAVFKDDNPVIVDEHANFDAMIIEMQDVVSGISVDQQNNINGVLYSVQVLTKTVGANDHYTGDLTRFSELIISYTDLQVNALKGKVLNCKTVILDKGMKF